MTPSDAITKLIVRTGLKDRQAFDALYRATSAKLFGVCLRILRDKAEAEEALQEVYIRVWTRSALFAATDLGPEPWLVAIARNHCIDRIRSSKPPSRELDEAAELASGEPSPETAAVLASEGRRIDGCMDELEPERAQAIRRAYVEGDSYEELARRFSVPLNTMRTWLRRSLIRLRECLER